MLAPALFISLVWHPVRQGQSTSGLAPVNAAAQFIALTGAASATGTYERIALVCFATLLGMATSLHRRCVWHWCHCWFPVSITQRSRLFLSFNIARMIGPALGAALVRVSAYRCLVMAAMMFMVSFWRLSRLGVERPPERTRLPPTGHN